MQKKYLLFAFLAVISVVGAGCFPMTNAYKSKHLPQASLSWYVYASDNDSETNVPKKLYQKRIEEYLKEHPQISRETGEKMKECWVTLGMTEEEVRSMVTPQYVLNRGRREKIFKYSNVGRIMPGKFIGEGTKVWVTFTNGIVTDISEVDLVIGY